MTESTEGDETPTNNGTTNGDELTAELLDDVASLVNDDRDTHGDAVVNQEHIARGWTWYLQGQDILTQEQELTGSDVARLMEILKMSRLCVGEYDVDHDLDRIGYSGIATACEILQGNVDVDEEEVIELDGVTLTIEDDE